MVSARLWRLFRALPVRGAAAFLLAILAVAIPTAIRAAANGVVTGCEFTPYLPFVLLSALLLRWWLASAVSLAAVAIMGGILEGSLHFETPCFLSAATMFAAASAVMIVVAVAARRLIASLQNPDHGSNGLVLSLEKGEVWASWYGHDTPIRLGNQRKVAEMMEDFLAQVKLGKRLNGDSGA